MRRALEAASTSTTSSQSSWPMRRQDSQCPQGVATGAMLDSEGRAREEGFSAFLRKPCLPQYLLHELRRFLPT